MGVCNEKGHGEVKVRCQLTCGACPDCSSCTTVDCGTICIGYGRSHRTVMYCDPRVAEHYFKYAILGSVLPSIPATVNLTVVSSSLAQKTAP